VLILIDVARALFAAKMRAFFDEEPADGRLLDLEMLRGDTIEEGSDKNTPVVQPSRGDFINGRDRRKRTSSGAKA
jgi:hypothetical protein